MKQYTHDKRIVMTLDAGGTNLRFSALRAGKEVVDSVHKNTCGHDLEKSLTHIIEGFGEIKKQLDEDPVAISFGFPGPTDYKNGIIGDLINLPAYRGGVALGPMLEEQFGIPVFISNDADLFTYGEAIAGILPHINDLLEQKGSSRRYRNLIGGTFGTGFGGGIAIAGKIIAGDNSAQAEINRMWNHLYPGYSVEESVSSKGVRRVYAREAGIPAHDAPTARDIFEIGIGTKEGSINAARKAYEELGRAAGNAFAQAATLIDGLVVIGGGLSGARKLFMPALVKEMNTAFKSFESEMIERLEMEVFDLTDEKGLEDFLQDNIIQIDVPFSNKKVLYNPEKKIGVGISLLGTSRATAIGAYAFAIQKMNY
ncbi:MAG TPA: ROK family protein [Candidatus Cloacimonetes bacterium]|nr:ROK family protein [Candidatus Cloacimonadota bacterium]